MKVATDENSPLRDIPKEQVLLSIKCFLLEIQNDKCTFESIISKTDLSNYMETSYRWINCYSHISFGFHKHLNASPTIEVSLNFIFYKEMKGTAFFLSKLV